MSHCSTSFILICTSPLCSRVASVSKSRKAGRHVLYSPPFCLVRIAFVAVYTLVTYVKATTGLPLSTLIDRATAKPRNSQSHLLCIWWCQHFVPSFATLDLFHTISLPTNGGHTAGCPHSHLPHNSVHCWLINSMT